VCGQEPHAILFIQCYFLIGFSVPMNDLCCYATNSYIKTYFWDMFKYCSVLEKKLELSPKQREKPINELRQIVFIHHS